jgi:hypothetical protein
LQLGSFVQSTGFDEFCESSSETDKAALMRVKKKSISERVVVVGGLEEVEVESVKRGMNKK